MSEARVAVIGGSGLYQMEGLEDVREVRPTTPFGDPSDAIVLGRVEGVPTAFLPRHGRGHRLSPSEVPARANFYALKSLGVERVVSVSAVGSLKEEVRPLAGERQFDKSVNSAFVGTGLAVHLQGREISSLVVVGLTTDHCVSATTRNAADLGFDVTLVADATATFERQDHEGVIHPAEVVHKVNLASLKGEFCRIRSTEELLTQPSSVNSPR